MWFSKRLLLMVGAAIVLAPDPILATIRTVDIGDFFFSPDSITVSVGDTVRWTHVGAFLHTTTSNSLIWDSGPMSNGDTFEFQFNSPGDFPYHCSFHSLTMNGTVAVESTTGVEDGNQQTPFSPILFQNSPNPFNPTTTIRFSLPGSGQASLTIFNLLGKQVATLVSGQMEAGTHRILWDASGQPSGVYFYQLSTAHSVQTRKLVLLR